MRFSVLLPTRNRLEYLKFAVQSVLRQGFEDWQLVISDNCSEEDIAGYVAGLGDERIFYRRTERVVPVTENWNRALAHSGGEHVVMLGDDDALLDGYLSAMDELLREFDDPDVIYTKALLFRYPGVDPEDPSSSLTDHGCAEFFSGASAPFVLEHERALELVRAAMGFRLRYDYNAQFALIARRLIDALGRYGDFYQSAFPDYYSMNAAFLHARRIVVDPSPRVIIGVTPKSYGYFHANRREQEGRAFLDGAAPVASVGTNINVGWLSAASALEQGPAAGFGLRVDQRRYRFVQAAYVHERYRAGVIDRDQLRRLERELPPLERWAYRGSSWALGLAYRAVPQRLREAMISLGHRVVGQLPVVAPAPPERRYRDVIEVIEGRSDERSAGAAQATRGQ